jgi:MucB/RseB N-terminal domain
MVRRHLRFLFWGSLSLFVLGVANLPAQYAKPPDAYSISYTESLMMPNQQVKIFRDGNQVVTEEFTPQSGQMPHPSHTRNFLHLDSHKSWTVDLQNPSVPCSVSTQGGSPGDWGGNPFEWLSGFFGVDLSKEHPAQLGTRVVAGRKAQVMQISSPDGRKAKIWVDAEYGLLLKMSMAGKNGQPDIPLAVKSFTVGKPPASVLAMPTSCTRAK